MASKSVRYIEFKRMDADLTASWNSGERYAACRHAEGSQWKMDTNCWMKMCPCICAECIFNAVCFCVCQISWHNVHCDRSVQSFR